MNFNAALWQLVTVLDTTPVLPNLQTNNDLHINLLIQLDDSSSPSTGAQTRILSVCLFTLKRLYLQACVCVSVYVQESKNIYF